MRKKIETGDLRLGMYVSELDRPWTETPFVFQGVKVDSPQVIEDLARYCNYVFIDEPDGHPGAETRRHEMELFRKTAQRALATPEPSRRHTTLEQEAREIQRFGPALAESLREQLAALRAGQPFTLAPWTRAAESLLDSVTRHPDALLCFAWLKAESMDEALHGIRVAILSTLLGEALGVAKATLEALVLGALLHDIGVTRLPAGLRGHRDPLTAAEEALFRTHVQRGIEIVGQVRSLPRMSLQVIEGHHERANGMGYPRGTRPPLPLVGQIAAVADHYDHLVFGGPGLAPTSPHGALLELYRTRDDAFPATLIERFTQSLGIYPAGSLVELSTGHIGVVAGVNRTRYLRPRVILVLDDRHEPYARPQSIDLGSQPRDSRGRAWEIQTVLPPGTHGVRPGDVLNALWF